MGPNLAVALVGDVSLPEVKRVAERYFGGMSDAPAPPPVDTVEPVQKAERRVILEDAAQPVIVIGWHVPAFTDSSYAAIEALVDLLASGDYARLNKRLVKEKKVAVRVDGFVGEPGEKYPGLAGLFVVPATGQDPLQVEGMVYAALDEIAAGHPLTDEELRGYKVRRRAERIREVEANANLAGALARTQALRGDWREYFREPERVQRLAVADLMSALTGRLTRSNRTVGLIVHPARAEEAKTQP